MYRKITGFLSIAAVVAAGSCTKKQSTVIPEKVIDTVYLDTTKVDTTDTSYSVNLSDLQARSIGKHIMAIQVRRNQGSDKRVELGIMDVPDKVKAKFTHTGGYPDFGTSVEFDVMFKAPGIYPMKVTATQEGGKTRAYSVNLKVDSMDKQTCVTTMNSSFRTAGAMFKGSTIDSSFIFPNYLTFNNVNDGEIYLRNLPLYHDAIATNAYMTLRNAGNDPNYASAHVKIMLVCVTGKLTIPAQDVVGRKVTGAGANVNFTVEGSGKVDPMTKMYEITYITTHIVGSTPVQITYTLKGQFLY